jgi:hypothetical protein
MRRHPYLKPSERVKERSAKESGSMKTISKPPATVAHCSESGVYGLC